MKGEEKKILFDHQIFDIQDYGGISRYFANLIAGVQNSPNFTAAVPIVNSSNYYIRDFPQLFNNALAKVILRKRKGRVKWNRILNERMLSNQEYDVFHPTYYNPYFLRIVKKPVVITIHDMIYENHPHLFPESQEVIKDKKILIESAQCIIAISEFTKSQILKHYPLTGSKVSVVHHGLPDVLCRAADDDLPDKYLLYVGDRAAAYKNFNTFLKGIATLLTEDNSLYLICAGGGDFAEKEHQEMQRLNIVNRVMQLDASESQMTQLYQNALVFIYPSLEEGFGIPLLEAFKHECTVASSSTSCFSEIGADAVAYFDPNHAESIYLTISNLLEDEELRLQYIKKGIKRLQHFTFEKSLRQTLACYQSLITENR